MRYYEIINEGRDYPLYHFMYDTKAVNVFENDMMPAKWEHNIPQMGLVKGNSFSRNKEFRMNIRPVRITIDHAKIAQTHKIIPLDGEYVFRNHPDMYTEPRHRAKDRYIHTDYGTQLAEEFIIGDIKNLHRYITKIEIRKSYETKFRIKTLVQTVIDYATKYNIPYSIHDQVIKLINEPEYEDNEL